MIFAERLLGGAKFVWADIDEYRVMEREERITNLRAISILIVVLGHSIIIYSDSWNLYHTIYNVPILNKQIFIRTASYKENQEIAYPVSFCFLFLAIANQNYNKILVIRRQGY